MADDLRSMYGKPLLGAWDLQGRDVTLTIKSVTAKKLKSARGEETKPIISFEETSKQFAVNATNRDIIAAMYGYKVSGLIGKKITLYPTQTSVGGKSVDAIRVRPSIPKGAADQLPDVPVDEDMRQRQEDAFNAAQ